MRLSIFGAFVLFIVTAAAPARAESDFWEEMANPGIRQYRAMVAQGVEHIDAGAYDLAIDALGRAAVSLPDEPRAQLWLAYALSRSNRHAEAVQSWERAHRLDDAALDEERLALEWAHSLAQVGRYAAAAEIHGRMLARGVSPRFRARVMLTMGDLLIAASCDGIDEAIDLFQDALRDDPNDASAHWRLAAALFRGGRRAEGESELAVAVRLDPQWGTLNAAEVTLYPSYDIHFFRALGWQHLRHVEQARGELQRYLDGGGAEGCWADLARELQNNAGRGGRGAPGR